MPHLEKPDMSAILERTHIGSHFDAFMLPIYEAGSNSIHSIIEKFGVDHACEKGNLVFDFSKGTTPDEFSVTIHDNGNGLDKDNYKAFRTPFTGNKLKKGGKGFGRFIAFKVFKEITYYSRSITDILSFKFDVFANEEIINLSGESQTQFAEGCSTTYRQIREQFNSHWQRLEKSEILESIARNFMTYLVLGHMPKTTVIFDGESFDVADHFNKVFSDTTTFTFVVELRDKAEDFTCDISRSKKGKTFRRHSLLFFADHRVLGAGRSIENKLGRPSFRDEAGGDYVIIASISGDFIDRNANTTRTHLEATEDEIAAIVDAACSKIGETESAQVDKIKEAQKTEVTTLLHRHPLLRSGLSGITIGEYVRSKPNNWRTENFVSDLALQRHREDRKWDSLVHDILTDKDKFAARRKELLNRVASVYRDALAEYVVHRRQILELAGSVIGADDDGKMNKEETIHNLIFPRYSDTESKKYFQHNLWMLDERLAFVSYVSSDRTLHGGRRALGDKITDIAFFDECYVSGGDGTNGLMIVEFKKPGRDDYVFGKDGADPVKQVEDTIEKIRDRGSFITTKGKSIDIPSSTPATAIVVCDLEPSLKKLAERYDFSLSWNKLGYFKYHETFDIYIEIMGYNTLISNAEKRNAAFFDILLNDIGA